MKVFSSSGVFFKYHGDILQWKWPWARNSGRAPYHSSLLNRDFNSIKEYWSSQGEVRSLVKTNSGNGKMHGFDIMEEIVPQWSARLWPNEYLVCLCNVNTSARGPGFWALLGKAKCSGLLKDVVVLVCKDRTEMKKLMDSIDTLFADAFGVFNGEVLETNSTGAY